MTWAAAEMPNDALDPTSLVGRMLNVKASSNSDQVRSLESPPPATVEPMPLWETMQHAREFGGEVAEIEALRDWLLPAKAAPLGDGRHYVRWVRDNQLRALLTEQARIAREGQ